MYHIGGIPGRRKNFFRKIVHAKSFTGRISQYFFKNPDDKACNLAPERFIKKTSENKKYVNVYNKFNEYT